MAEQFYTILTNIGKAKIANSLPTGQKLNLVKMKIGDSNGNYYNPSENQTDLVHKIYECNITNVEVDAVNPQWITITAAIPSDVGGFSIREVGVFDDTNSLIAVGKYPETYKPVAADGSTKELYIKMTLEVTNAASVALKIDPTVILATKKDVANIDTKIEQVNTQLSDRMKDVLSISRKIANATTTINIKIIGDSITAGAHGTGYSPNGETIYGTFKVNTSGHCWANSLKSYLESNFNCSVKNYGCSGIRSTEMVANLSSLINSTDDIIICTIGTNNRNTSDGISNLNNDIKIIYDYVKNLNKEIIFISSIPASITDESARIFNMKDVDNAIMNATSNLGIEYISLYKLFIKYYESNNLELNNLLDDGLHPNDTGYDIMYYLILNELGFGISKSISFGTSDNSFVVANDANNCGTVTKWTTDKINNNTLNTPYTEGLTGTSSYAVLKTYKTSTLNGMQIAYYSAIKNGIYTRELFNGTWGAWHVVVPKDTGWIMLPLSSGSVVTGYEPQYRKIGNRVFLRGRVTGLTATGVFATMPTGYTIPISSSYNTAFNNIGIASVFVSLSGTLNIVSTPVSADLLYLNGISYLVD